MSIEQLDLEHIRDLDEPGVHEFYEKLVLAKERAVTDLQASVFQNYAEFVVISKEISKVCFPRPARRALLPYLYSLKAKCCS